MIECSTCAFWRPYKGHMAARGPCDQHRYLITHSDFTCKDYAAMPLKPRVKVKAGSKKLEPGYDVKDGKIVPVEKRKPVPQRIKDRKKQKWRAAK